MQFVSLFFNPRLARGVWFSFILLDAGANLASAAAPAVGLDFDRTFTARGEPPQLHFQASYVTNNQRHQTDIWRNADRQLKRVTDGRLETHVFKPANQDDWRMVVLDRTRKIRTDINRTNLLRIGHFTDWFSLSHALARPVGAYQLVPLATTPDMPKPVARCRWYSLSRNGVASHLCWSTSLRLPLVITDDANRVQWQVTAVDTKAQPGSTFDIVDIGFVHNNANEEIQSD